MEIHSDINGLLRRYEEAVRTKNIDGILELHSDEIETFDLMTPFQYSGKETLKERLQTWLESYDGEIYFNFTDVRVMADEIIGVCHALVKTSGKLKDGTVADMWTRSSLGLRMENDEWKIFHEHTSEPIDMETGRAVTSLN